MSGPKMSKAEIERQKREALERERRRRMQLIMEINARYQQIRDIVAELKAIRDSLDLVVGAQDAKDAITQAISQISATGTVTVDDDVDMLHTQSAEMLKKARQIADRVRGKLQTWNGRSAAQTNQIRQSTQLVTASVTLDTIAKESEIIRQNVSFVSDGDHRALDTFLQSMLAHAASLKQSGDKKLEQIGVKALAELAKFRGRADLTADRDKLFLLAEQLTNAEQERLREIREMDELYSQYAALAVMAGKAPSPRDAFADIAALQEQVDELTALIARQDEMDYIADQINEVMVELGYTFVTSKAVARQGRDADHSLYQADDDTGISVFTDSDGTVTMWVTNLTDKDEPISDADREFSYQRQLDFCANHQDIVDALRKRGIRLIPKRYERADRKHTQKAVVQRNAQNRKKKEDRRKNRSGRNVPKMQSFSD